MSTVELLLMAQWHCISHFAFYIDAVKLNSNDVIHVIVCAGVRKSKHLLYSQNIINNQLKCKVHKYYKK